MLLNEILKEDNIELISEKTKISKFNLEAISAAEFDKLRKVKSLGFISILEREYKVELTALREQALEYYDKNSEIQKVTLTAPKNEEKSGSSKWFKFFILIVIAYTVWYFFTQFDKNMLTNLIPITKEKISLTQNNGTEKELKVEKASENSDIFDQ